jgi:hypothetical protein
MIRPNQLPSRRVWPDRVALATLTLATFTGAEIVNVHERLHRWHDRHELYNPFELLPAVTALAVLGVAYLILTRRRLRQEIAIRQEREAALTEALHTIEVLSDLLAMCSSCKSIRNDDGRWVPVETYLQRHGEVAVSHGICPQCAARLYPGYAAAR